MWQLSGAHGFEPQFNKALAEMSHCADEGFTTFDLADHYGPAEDYVGGFSKGRYASPLSKNCQFFTKWVPMPVEITRKKATEAIDLSLRRMQTDRLDLLQFHWWDYKNKYYYDALDHLMHLQEDGKIRNIGLTNFDTEHLADLMEEGAPIVSNQIAYSIIDTRPQKKMAAFCTENDVKLLCYGTLMGGFVSADWLNKPVPDRDSLTNVSLRKYLPWIMYWGGWDLFQEMLSVLDVIAKKHAASISNVAVRWVLDQPAVGGAIVGVRFGLKEHVDDNRRVFKFALDDNDRAAIAAVQSKGRDLTTVFGDCGGEYRRRG
jgi:aryl-alcohol dehydrogenase-like predicted oxidoreductase